MLAKEHSRTPEKARGTKFDFLLSDCDCLKTELLYVYILVWVCMSVPETICILFIDEVCITKYQVIQILFRYIYLYDTLTVLASGPTGLCLVTVST